MSPEGKKYSYIRPTKDGKKRCHARLDKWITSVDVRKRQLNRKSFERSIEEAWKHEIGKFFKIVNREKMINEGAVMLELEIKWEKIAESWVGRTEYPEIAESELREQLLVEDGILSRIGEELIIKVMPGKNLMSGENALYR